MALTIQDIIDEADERYPNDLTVASKLRKITERENQLLRNEFREKTSTTFDISVGQFLYPLDFSKGKIIGVLVNGCKYDYEDIDSDTDESPYYYTYNNSIGLYPTPGEDIEGGLQVFHWLEAPQYTSDNLSASPSIDQDYHMLLVFGLCADMAAIDLRDDVANGYIAQYNGLLEDYKRADSEPELPPIRVV